MKATNLEFVTTTVKVLLLCGLALVVSASPALADTYCCQDVKYFECKCDTDGPGSPIDSTIIGGMKILVCENCGIETRNCNCDPYDGSHAQRIKNLKALGKPSPTEVPRRHFNKTRHYDAKAKPNRGDVTGIPKCARQTCPPFCGGGHGAVLWTGAKTPSGELIDRASSIRKAPRGQNAYRRGAASGNGTLDGKVTVCERCGGDCTSCSCSGGFPTGIRVRPNVDGQKYDDFKWLLDPRHPERSRLNDDARPDVDGQKYDDRDPSLDPRRPEQPVPSKLSRPNVNGRPNADRQGNGGLIGIPKTGGHLKRPTPIPPPAVPYKRKVIVRDYLNQGPVPHGLPYEQQNQQRLNPARQRSRK